MSLVRIAAFVLLGALALGVAPAIAGEAAVAPSGNGALEVLPASQDRVMQAWRAPGQSLAVRVEQATRAAHQQDLAALDTLARAVLRLEAGGVTPVERAEAAAQLAPDLPLAQAQLAAARADSGDWAGAARAGLRSLVALTQHLEASAWATATLSWLAVLSLVVASLLFLGFRALGALPAATHDLGDLLPGATPGYGRVAWMAALLGIPWLLGEGVLGFALLLFALTICYGSAGERRAGFVAALLLLASLYPLAHWSGVRLGALDADPLADAVWRAERGALDPVAAARIDALAAEDPLGRRALARRAHRSGQLELADTLYAALIAEDQIDASLLNDAANVKLALGLDAEAISLYQQATKSNASAVVWFNLSQAYAAKFRTSEHQDALEMAQSLDEARVRELTARLARLGSGVANLPLPGRMIRARMEPDRPPDMGAMLRAHVAPGILGREPLLAAGLFALAGALAAVFGARFEPSRGCALCGGRICERCQDARSGDVLCAACGPHAERPTGAAAAVWKLRRSLVRASQPIAWLLPGVVSRGVRPELGLLALLAAVGAVLLALGHDAVVPDPLAAGAAGPAAFIGLALALALLHVLLAAVLRRAR